MLSQYGSRLTHVTTDVSVWSSLLSLFNAAIAQHKKVDHVFVAAGISGARANYLAETFDPETGELQEPLATTFNINLRGTINTAYLGLYHMRHQSPAEGSIVLTASGSAFLRFRRADYTSSKHGVLGFMRGLVPALADHPSNIRINCISPSWTRTGMLPSNAFDHVGYSGQMQDAEVVARSVVLLMADQKRHGQNIYSRQGRFWEVEDAFMKLARDIVGEVDEDMVSLFPWPSPQPFNVVDLTNYLPTLRSWEQFSSVGQRNWPWKSKRPKRKSKPRRRTRGRPRRELRYWNADQHLQHALRLCPMNRGP